MSEYSWSGSKQDDQARRDGYTAACANVREGLEHLRERDNAAWKDHSSMFRTGYHRGWRHCHEKEEAERYLERMAVEARERLDAG